MSLRVCDVFNSDGSVKPSITVERRNMKGRDRSRTVALSEASRNFVASQHCPQMSFYNAKLFDFGRRAANQFLNVARIKAGVPNRVACHSMRKTFAKRVFELSGKDLTITQKLMGHKSINSTIQYLEVDQDRINEVVEAL